MKLTLMGIGMILILVSVNICFAYALNWLLEHFVEDEAPRMLLITLGLGLLLYWGGHFL